MPVDCGAGGCLVTTLSRFRRRERMTLMTKTTTSVEFTREEVGLAVRNHGMHLEGMRHPVTPAGMHYLLIHFDIPFLEGATYELPIT